MFILILSIHVVQQYGIGHILNNFASFNWVPCIYFQAKGEHNCISSEVLLEI